MGRPNLWQLSHLKSYNLRILIKNSREQNLKYLMEARRMLFRVDFYYYLICFKIIVGFSSQMQIALSFFIVSRLT